MKKLNVGAGADVRDGWINLDSHTLAGIDVVHDIESTPLPFSDGYFDEILCQDVLEHVDLIKVLKDLHRILKIGGLISIRVPHFTSKNNYIDPTHKKLFSAFAFDYFVENAFHSKSKLRNYYFDFSFSEIQDVHISFERSKRLFFYNAFVERIVNISRDLHYIYESTGCSRIFPAENLHLKLRK